MSNAIKRLSITEEDRGSVPSTEVPNASENQHYQWYRGVFFQATIVGFCAFTAPGLWNAMQSVGAGGQQTPYLVM